MDTEILRAPSGEVPEIWIPLKRLGNSFDLHSDQLWLGVHAVHPTFHLGSSLRTWRSPRLSRVTDNRMIAIFPPTQPLDSFDALLHLRSHVRALFVLISTQFLGHMTQNQLVRE